MGQTLHDVVANLHKQGVINLDTPLRALVTAAPQLAPATAGPERNGDMFFGSWYVYFVAGSDAPRLAEIAGVASEVRSATKTQEPAARDIGSFITADQATILGQSGLIDLDRPLGALLQPEGIAGLIRIEGGVSAFITHRYCIVHVA